MNPQVDHLLQSALSLPDEDQLRLLAALSSAIEERGLRPFDDSWLGEVQRRSAELDAGLVRPIPWPEVKARARQQVEGKSPDA